MTVLAERPSRAAEIDVDARARRPAGRRGRARAALAPIDPEYAAADAKRRWAQARLDVAAK